MSKELTEKWKNKELKEGWYYVSRNNDIEMLEYVGDYFLSVDVPLIDDKDVSTLEVLAPVPSYEENKKLRDLLTECVGLLYLIRTDDKANLGVAMLGGIHGTIVKIKEELKK